MKIFFDLDGTLLDEDHAVKSALESFESYFSETLDPKHKGNFITAWRKVAREAYDRYLGGELTFQEQRRARVRALSAVELSDSAADALFDRYLTFYEDSWRLFDDVLPVLGKLEGGIAGVITNGNGEQQRRKIKTLGLDSYISVTIASEDVGASKPNSEIFQLACAAAGLDAAECFYVGDMLGSDAEASSAAGMRGVWLNRGRCEQERNTHVPTIHTLLELCDLMSR